MKLQALFAILIMGLLSACALIGEKGEPPIAKVGDEKITFEDILPYFDQYKRMQAQGNTPLSEKDSLELIRLILDNEITARVLLL